MFQELYDIAKQKQSVSLIITTIDDKLNVVVVPKGKEGEAPVLSQPLCINGTPDELEESFIDDVNSYRRVMEVGKNNLDEIKKNVSDAQDAAKKAPATTATKKATTKKVAKKSSMESLKESRKEPAPAKSSDDDDLQDLINQLGGEENG